MRFFGFVAVLFCSFFLFVNSIELNDGVDGFKLLMWFYELGYEVLVGNS